MSSLGEHLRQIREAKHLSVEDLSRLTKISSRFITALEAEDFGTLPGGVFNRGFIKSYAKFCGADESPLLLEYDEELKRIHGPDLIILPSAPASSGEFQGYRPFYGIAVFLFLVFIFISLFMYFRSHSGGGGRKGEEVNTATPASSTVPSSNQQPLNSGTQNSAIPPVLPHPPPAESGSAAGSTPASTSPAGVSKMQTSNQSAINVPMPAGSAGQDAGGAAARTIPGSLPEDLRKRPAVTKSLGENTTEPGQKPFTLQIVATAPAWLSIKKDGKEVYRKVMLPGETLRYSARDKFDIVCGNAGGVNLELDGIPVGPLGKSGEVKTKSFQRPMASEGPQRP
jgi:cytoskeleton protein RodZ